MTREHTQYDMKDIECQVLQDYIEELETRVTMPDLYRRDYHTWERMVKGTLRHPTEEKIDWKMMAEYEEVRGTTKHNYDWFIMNQEIWNSMHRYEAERLNDLDTEGFMEIFDVDRPTALMLMSVHRRKVILEPEWITIKCAI